MNNSVLAMRTILSYIKKSIKIFIAYFLYYSGLTNYYISRKLSNSVIVLTYHRTLPTNKRQTSYSHHAIMVDPVNFDMHLNVLSEQFDIIDITSFGDLVRSGAFVGKPRCLITFDDGWGDNYDYAFQILKKHQCPAVIFIPTDYVSSKVTFWQETLGYQISKLFELNTPEAKYLINKLDISEGKINKNEIMNYVRTLKSLPYNKIHAIMKEITSVIDDKGSSDTDRHLSWDQLKELSQSNIAIGSHARTHRILTHLSQSDIEIELSESKKVLESKLGYIIDTIAYPNGNYDENLGELTKKAGYTLGFGTEYGYVSEQTDIYNIKRINMNDTITWSKPMLLATILGLI